MCGLLISVGVSDNDKDKDNGDNGDNGDGITFFCAHQRKVQVERNWNLIIQCHNYLVH